MPPEDDTTAAGVSLGPVGRYVIENLKQLREARRLSYRELSDRLKELGRPIPTLGLSRIEKGARRVDADDLAALALALGVNPSALLLPRDSAPDEVIPLSSTALVTVRDAWNWADGRAALPEAGPGTRSTADLQMAVDFAANARPGWAPLPDSLQAMGFSQPQASNRPIPVEEALEQPVATAIVTSDLGVLIGRRNDGKPPWTFIAGEVEPGESPADAAIREVKEETGLRVQVADVIGERVHPKTGRTMIYMAATPTHGTDVIVGDEDELAEVRWASLAEADELMAAYGMYEPVHDYLSTKLGQA